MIFNCPWSRSKTEISDVNSDKLKKFSLTSTNCVQRVEVILLKLSKNGNYACLSHMLTWSRFN